MKSKRSKTQCFEKQKGLCFYCQRVMDRTHIERKGVTPPDNQATWDHKTPLTRGGKHNPSNLVLACRSCNGQKDDMTVKEFLEYRATCSPQSTSLQDSAGTPSGPPERASM